MQPGIRVPKLGGPVADGTPPEDSKLHVQNALVLDSRGDEIEHCPPITNQSIEMKSMVAHPASQPQVVHDSLKLIELRSGHAGSDSPEQVFRVAKMSHSVIQCPHPQ